MKERTKAYMAGFIDAEGCFSIGKTLRNGTTQYCPQLILVNNHKPVMKWVTKNFGGTIKTIRHSDPKWNDSYRWVIANEKHIHRFISLILPYLTIKKEQAKILLSYYTEDKENAYSKLVELKRSVTTETLNLPKKKTLLNAYLSGFFDGEGHIGVSAVKQYNQSGIKYMPAISLANTCLNIVNCYSKTYGGFTTDRPGNGNNKPSRTWFLNGQKNRELFLLSSIPYLIVKKEQAKLMLNFVRLYGKQDQKARNKIMLEIKSFNGRKIQSELMGDHENDLIGISNSKTKL